MNNENNFESVVVKNAAKNKKDQRPARRRRFNILDAIIILVFLSAVGLVIAVYSPLDIFGNSGEKTKITYTVEIQGVDPALAAGIAVGDTVMNEKGYVIGQVASPVEVDAYSEYYYNSVSGEVEYAEHPDLSNLLIVITLNADSDQERGFSTNGLRIAVGAEYTLVLPGFEGEGSCISIIEEKIEEGDGK